MTTEKTPRPTRDWMRAHQFPEGVHLPTPEQCAKARKRRFKPKSRKSS